MSAQAAYASAYSRGAMTRSRSEGRSGTTPPRSEGRSGSAVLDISDLHVTFPTAEGPVSALRGVDLTLEPGRVLGVVGESGSGKTVTMLATLGLLPSSAEVKGSVKYKGREL